MPHDPVPETLDACDVDTTGACITHPCGGHSCAAGLFNVSLMARGAGPDRLRTVVLALFHRANGPGLHIAWHPHAARDMAAALIKAADDADVANASAAGRMLSETLGCAPTAPASPPDPAETAAPAAIPAASEAESRVRPSRNQPPAPLFRGDHGRSVAPGMIPVAMAVMALVGAVLGAILVMAWNALVRMLWS